LRELKKKLMKIKKPYKNKLEKFMKNLTTSVIVITILALIVLGCSKSDDKSANTSNTTSNSNSNGSANSSDNKSDANTKPRKVPVSEDGDDVAGNYGITGKNLAGQSYRGDLTIKKQDQVYQFSWNVDGSAYDGVGVRDGELIAVGYGAGENGKGCGAAIYRIGEKTLDGRLGGWGFNQVGTQSAVLIKENGDGGVFTVVGTDTDGSDYKGELYVAKGKADVYHLAFTGGKINYIGTGIKVGDYFGVGMGVKQCGYVVYDIKDDRLEAAWGVIGSDKLGTEIATKK
jgi:hypothetical protein